MREYLLTPVRGASGCRPSSATSSRAAGAATRPYSLPADVEFAFVLAGRLHITVDGEEVTLEQGDAYTFHADAPHTFRSAAGIRPDSGALARHAGTA